MLLHLPEDLSRYVVTERLEAAALVRLDTAVCNSKRRSQYLTLLTLTNVAAEICSLEFFHWAHLRGVVVSHIILGKKFKSFSDGLEGILKKVKKLWIQRSLMNPMTHLINQCENLVELKCNYANIEFILMKDSALSKLEVLEVVLSSDRCPRNRDLRIIANSCPQLQALSIPYISTPANDMALLDIFRSNRLSELALCVDSSVLMEIATHCSKLKKLNISGDFSILSFAQVLTQCRQLIQASAVGPALDCVVDQTKSALSLRRITRGGVSEFAAAVDVHHLTLQASLVIPGDIWAVLIDQWGTRLISLTIESSQPPSILRYCLDHCTTLKSFIYKCGGDGVVNWKDVLSESNQLERIEFVSSKVDICYILKCCHCLSSVSFVGPTIRTSEVKTFVDAIRNYRHCMTNKPVRFSCTNTLQSARNTLSLRYDGTQFSGTLWNDYCRHNRIPESTKRLWR